MNRRPGVSSTTRSSIIAASIVAIADAAHAQAPQPWQMGLQAAHSPVQRDIASLNDFLLYIIIGIVVFVAGLLAYVVFRFNARANPVPSRTTHNTLVEVAWTVIPVLILVAISIPSLKLVYFEDRTLTPDLTIKVTGHQWYWEYTYPDRGGIDFTSYMVPGNKLAPDQKNLRQLAVDNALVVPTGKNIRVLITSADVLHAWFVPAFGVQRYAIPGRVIETWFNVDKPGDYFGECNQICGINHDAMSIDVHAVSPADFQVWLKSAKDKYSALHNDTRYASLDPASVR
jgi:cytochrome c oxidase subunit 2